MDIYNGSQLIVQRKNAKVPEGFLRLDVTSHNTKARQWFSPFYLGPIKSADGVESQNMENLWQFSKVYPDMVDENGEPTEEFFKWRLDGFRDTRAHRHPHPGKPLYSWWNGERLGYIEARKRIYIPSYAKCVYANPYGLNAIKEKIQEGYRIAICDFDGYDFKKLGMTYEQVINTPDKIMGHGHVLAMMVERPDLVDEMIRCSY